MEDVTIPQRISLINHDSEDFDEKLKYQVKKSLQ